MGKMRAFAVLENCENKGGIVFAEHAVVARRLGANEYSCGDFYGVSCRRAPWADIFAGSSVPANVMISHGWHFECVGCGETINEDWLYDEELTLDGVIGYDRGLVYCSEICEARHNLERAEARDRERRALVALKAYVAKRFPKVEFRDDGNWRPRAHATKESGAWLIKHAVVSFDFPGMKIGPATCRLERGHRDHWLIGPMKPEYSCCFGDKESFEAWAASPASRMAGDF